MTRQGAIDIIVVLMCIGCGFLGFVLGRGLPPEPSLEPYIACLEDNRCVKDVDFYVEYYAIKSSLNTP